MEFSIILPIHNEQINAKKLILEILNLYPDKTYEILAVNDYSNDKTLEMLKEIESEKLSIISHSVNLGQSRAKIIVAHHAKYIQDNVSSSAEIEEPKAEEAVEEPVSTETEE